MFEVILISPKQDFTVKVPRVPSRGDLIYHAQIVWGVTGVMLNTSPGPIAAWVEIQFKRKHV